jgi:hypothetical protein
MIGEWSAGGWSVWSAEPFVKQSVIKNKRRYVAALRATGLYGSEPTDGLKRFSRCITGAGALAANSS